MMETGEVTSVYYDDGVPICTVEFTDRGHENDQTVPVMRRHHGMYLVPEEGQNVQMLKLDDQRFITGVLDHGDSYEDPGLTAGEFAFQFDNNTKLTFTENDDGTWDINLSASGDIHLDADGSIYLQGIEWSTHVHPFDDKYVPDTGDGSGSATTESDKTSHPQDS